MRIFLLIIGFWLLLTKVVLSYIPITLIADPKIACIGCSISFSVNSPCNLTGATYYWYFGDGQTETTNTPYTSHTYTNPGNYTASVLVVKSNDSGSGNVTLNIYKLGTFRIAARKVHDIPNHPTWFHINAFQTLLNDYTGKRWNAGTSHPVVKYKWWNCIDGEFFSSDTASSYTFETIFTWDLEEACAVRGYVFCPCNEMEHLFSNTVTFRHTNRAQ
jgi:PKD repeat protein